MRVPSTKLMGATAAAALAVFGIAAAVSGVTGGQAGRPGMGTAPAQGGPAASARGGGTALAGFSWLRPRPAPASWRRATLPGKHAVLSYPGWLRPQRGDKGTVTVGLDSRAGAVLAYLNVTPRQGAESLRNWTGFRLEHLREDGETAVRLEARSAVTGFRGGQGRCVMDDYVTRVRGNHYREIACLVQHGKSASVLVAAAATADWQRYGTVLERVVTAYRAG